MRRSRFGDAGGAGSGRKLAAGYWLGPGSYVYYVSADQSVQVVAKGNKFLYKMVSGTTAGAIRNELMVKGKHYGSSSKAAFQAAGLPLTGGAVSSSTRSSSSPPTPPPLTTPSPPSSETSSEEIDYTRYGLIGAGILGALGGLYLLFSSPSPRA